MLKKWRVIKLNAILVKKSKQKPEYDARKDMLKNAFQLYYKELRLVSEYVSLNLRAFNKVLL
jgi:hypothetical protein